jgi:phage gp46-like protein
MAEVRVRIGEGEKPQPNLLWDSVWSPPEGAADWAIAGADEPLNRGGLRSKAALSTAIVLALFTDRRIPDQHPLRKYVTSSDPRGWWGNDIDVRADLGEEELGSLLWVFARAVLTEQIRLEVIACAQEALQCLINQGAAVRIDVQAQIEPALNRCDLFVQVYGRDGSKIHDVRFNDIWQQTVAQ